MLKPFEDQYIDIHTHRKSCRSFVFFIRNVLADEMDNDQYARPDTFSIGIHPWHFQYGNIDSQIRIVDQYSKYAKVLAVGECGLDKSIKTPIDQQIEIFQQHIEISEKRKKPLIVHNVNALEEILSIRKETQANIPWIFHGYSGSLEAASQIFDAGCYISIGKELMEKDSTVFSEFSKYPLDKLFFETDENSFTVIDVYEIAADFLKIYVEQVKEQIFANYIRLFDKLTA